MRSVLVFGDIPVGEGRVATCVRCGRPPEAEYAEHGSIAARIDDSVRRTSLAGVFFTGPEPLRHPDFEELVARAVRAGAPRVGVRTGGSGLANADAVARLLRAGVSVVEVGFLGSCRDTHDALAGVPGAHDVASGAVTQVHAVAESLGVPVAVRGRMQVCRHSLTDLPAAVMRLAELRVSSIVLAHEPTFDPRRSVEWVGAACDTGTVNRVWVSVEGVAGEMLGDKALHAQDVIELWEETS